MAEQLASLRKVGGGTLDFEYFTKNVSAGGVLSVTTQKKARAIAFAYQIQAITFIYGIDGVENNHMNYRGNWRNDFTFTFTDNSISLSGTLSGSSAQTIAGIIIY